MAFSQASETSRHYLKNVIQGIMSQAEVLVNSCHWPSHILEFSFSSREVEGKNFQALGSIELDWAAVAPKAKANDLILLQLLLAISQVFFSTG